MAAAVAVTGEYPPPGAGGGPPEFLTGPPGQGPPAPSGGSPGEFLAPSGTDLDSFEKSFTAFLSFSFLFFFYFTILPHFRNNRFLSLSSMYVINHLIH